MIVTGPAQGATLSNTATVTSATPDPVAANNTSSAATTVTASADVSIVKSGTASVAAGGAVNYSLVVANAGPSNAASLTVTDTLPAGVTFVSASGTGWSCTNSGNVSVTCTRAALGTGTTAPTINVVVTAPAAAGTLSNTAAVSSTTSDPNSSNNSSSATTTVTASADLGIVKTGPATVVAGSNISYSLAVSNAGPSAAASLTMTDTLPVGVVFVSASGGGWSCSNAGVTVTCTRAALASGASAPDITIVVTAPQQAASLNNTASIASATADPNSANNSSSAPTTVTASADVSIVKSGPPTVTASGSVSYTFTVNNAGPSDAANVSVVDTLPAGVTFVSATGGGWLCTNSGNVSVTCTRAALAAGATAPLITVVVTAPAQGTTLTNTVAVASTTPDPNNANNSSSVTTDVTASADLSIVKTGPGTVTAGGSVSYALVVANGGPSDAASVSVTDTLPAGVTFVSATGGGWACSNAGNVSVTCTRPALAAGATAPTVTLVITAPNQAGSLSNTASVASTTADPNSANNSSSATTTVTASADLSIVKTGPGTVTAGGSVSYALAVANAGPSDAASVSVTDTLPAGVTFVSASGGGWSCTNSGNVSVTCTRAALGTGATAPTITVVVTAPGQATSLTNTASVTAATSDPTPGNNTSSAVTAVTASADLSIVKSGPGSVTASGSVTYSLVVANAGPSDAANVSVTDTLPAGVTFGSASGGGWSCTNSGNVSVTCTRPALASGATAPTITLVVSAPAQASTLTNTVSVASTTPDPNNANNSSSAVTTVGASANLSVTKTGPASVNASGSVTYSLVVANAGPSDATNLTVTDTLPAGVTFVSAAGGGWGCTNAGNTSVTCTRAALATGATAPAITIVVTAPAQGATLNNSATVTASTSDPNPGNNTDSATTTVTPLADLSLVKGGPASVTAGGSVTYSLVVANAGPSDAASLSVSDTLPAGVTFVSAVGTGWSCSNTGNTSVTCTRAALGTGATAPAITVLVTAPAQAATLTNTATVSSATNDPTPGNNTSSAVTTVGASADLSIVKSGPASVTASGSVTYSLVVANAGPSDAASPSVSDTLPAGVTFVSAAGGGWACTNSGNVSVTCTRAALATGATAPTITVVVTAPAQAATLTNTATVSSATNDPTPGNNTSSAVTTVSASADLSIVKSGPASVTASGSVTYSLVVANAGPSDAVSLSVSDTLPAGVVFGSASGGGWSCTNSGNVSVTCTRAGLATGATAPTITIVVTAPAQAGTLTNIATVTSSTNDPAPGNNTSTVLTSVAGSADLSIVKSGPASVTASGSVTYSLVVANAGPSDAASVSVTDTLPAGVTFVSAVGTGWSCSNAGNVSVTCTRATLATGATAPTITVVVTAPAQAATLTNTATVSSSTNDPTPGNNTSSAATTVSASADLSIVKSGPASVTASGSVTYLLVVANAGPSDAASVSVADSLPAGVAFVSAVGTGWSCSNTGNTSVTCTRAALAAGATAPTITVVVTAPAQAATLTNTATVSSSTNDPAPGNNTSNAVTTVGASADLSIVKSGPAGVSAGDQVTYVLAVANVGPSDATAVSVTDTLPAGVTFVSAAGAGWLCANSGDVSVTCTRAGLATGTTAPDITVIVTAPNAVVTLTNQAAVTSATADPDPTNNTDSATTDVGPLADLSLVKSGPATVVAGGSVSYSLIVTNDGPTDASDLSVTDTLPAGSTFVSVTGTGWSCSNTGSVSATCTRASLAAGTSAPAITLVVTAPGQAGSLTNTATVDAATADPDLANNTDDAVTTVTALADLSLVKSGPAAVAPSGTVTYTLAVTNSGPSDASSISVTDTLPSGVSFVSASGGGWTCANAGDTSVTCTRATLATGATSTLEVVVVAPGQSATLVNSATVTSSTTDPDPGDNSSSASTVVGASADLSLTKTGPASVAAGASITYQLAVSNAGPDSAQAVVVTDELPAGVTFVSAGGSGWGCSNDSDASVTCTRSALANGATAPVITVVVTAPSSAGDLTNNAGVSAATFDPVDDNNAALAATEVLASATGGGPLPGTGGHGFGGVWLGLLLLGLGLALRSEALVLRRRTARTDEGG